jgi:hypothetical protein
MVYIHGGFLVFGSNGAEPAASQANWMRARPSGQLASGEFRSLEQVGGSSSGRGEPACRQLD